MRSLFIKQSSKLLDVFLNRRGITMFKNMPRQMFGRVQAKLFPM